MLGYNSRRAGMFLGAVFTFLASPNAAAAPPSAPAPSYARLASLADSAPLIARVKLRQTVTLKPAQATGLRPGWVRIYAESQTEALLAGTPIGEQLRYLVDVPLDPRGKPPVLMKREVVVFARGVVQRPGELQLITPDSQLLWDPTLEARLRAILAELRAPDAPPAIVGVREASYVPGNLAGEGETQLFLDTQDGSPASITVVHAPGAATHWGASFSEVVDPAARPPVRDTLAWYRLACSLPAMLPPGASVSATPADHDQAEADYRLVLSELGPCDKTR